MLGFFRRLVSDQKGSVLPMMAAGMIPVLAAIGSAVDIGRVYMVRAQMQAGVDAAALAGARSFGLTTQRTEQVQNYFLANMPNGLLSSGEITPVAEFQTTSGINRVKVDAGTDLPMVFMQLFGVQTINVSVTATAEMQPKPLEVMVVLDDTGSMKENLPSTSISRMSALKTAMYDFISILHQGKAKRDDLAMGFVTYTVTTNVGKILKDAGVTIAERDGFTNVDSYTGVTNDPLGWRGCVENDQSVQEISASATTFDTGAFDIDKVLPGENGRPGVRPYHYPPLTTTKSTTATGDTTAKSGAWATTARKWENYQANNKNTDTGDSRRNNLYRLGPIVDTGIGQTLANTPAYRQHFYDFYIGLNYDAADPTDDVIELVGGGYYAPGSGSNWQVNYSKIPYVSATTDWAVPNAVYGYPTRTGKNLKMPTPNWQCPEPAMAVQYGRNKSTYDDYITYDNHPVMPASGTLHHIGMLWGYRLLTRSDVFTRTNPIPSEQPLRALVFMTDGDTAANGDAAWYGAYGGLREKRISNSATDVEQFKTNLMRRFAKVCENAKRDGITVYIVSLLPATGNTQTVFRTCAGANYLETSTQSEIQNAFRQIAVDLVDLHLTQ